MKWLNMKKYVGLHYNTSKPSYGELVEKLEAKKIIKDEKVYDFSKIKSLKRKKKILKKLIGKPIVLRQEVKMRISPVGGCVERKCFIAEILEPNDVGIKKVGVKSEYGVRVNISDILKIKLLEP